MKQGIIYKIISPSNKIYIGQTVNLYMRKAKYKRQDCKKQRKLYNSIVKYGWGNHTIEVIETIEIIDSRILLDEREIYWINLFDSYNNGLNCTEGGNSRHNYIVSDETREKLRIASTGRIVSDDTKQKIKEANLGKKHSEETKDKIKAKRKNQVITQETKDKMSKTRKEWHPKVNYDNLANGVKYCPKCQETKSIDEFNKSDKHKDGRRTPCKACRSLQRKDPEYRLRHAEYSKERYNKIKMGDHQSMEL